MAKIRELLGRIQITYRRTPNLTKVVVTVAIVLCMATLITLRLSITDLQNRTEDLRKEAGMLEEANDELREDIANADSVKGVVEFAEKELGLIQPGSVFFETEAPEETENGN